MFDHIAAGDFYLLCPDNETTRAMDEKRIAWAAGDIIENRPALSRVGIPIGRNLSPSLCAATEATGRRAGAWRRGSRKAKIRELGPIHSIRPTEFRRTAAELAEPRGISSARRSFGNVCIRSVH